MKSITALTAAEFGGLYQLLNFNDNSYDKLSFFDSENTFRWFLCRTPESHRKQQIVAINALLMTLMTCYTGMSYTAVAGREPFCFAFSAQRLLRQSCYPTSLSAWRG
jgi:hypothetical protein